MNNFGEDKVKETWDALCAWHKEVVPTASSKPYYKALDKQTEDCDALYRCRNLSGTLQYVPSNARPTPKADHLPLNDEHRRATRKQEVCQRVDWGGFQDEGGRLQ